MRILVPTDFSKNATHAINYASAIAKASGSELKLFCVCTPALTRNNVAQSQIAAEMVKAERAAQEQLANLSHEISATAGISCDSQVRTGGIVDEIIRAAIDNRIDMIVMGTKGAKGVGKFLFGSNTAEVIEATPCPVLAVPADAVIELPKKIVFATNYLDSDIQTLKQLGNLVEVLNAELIILHVAKEKLKSDRDLIEEFSKTVARETGLVQPFYFVLSHEDIQQGINLFIDSVSADLVVLSTRKRKVFEKLFDASLTKKIAYQARLPLLAYHANENEVFERGN